MGDYKLEKSLPNFVVDIALRKLQQKKKQYKKLTHLSRSESPRNDNYKNMHPLSCKEFSKYCTLQVILESIDLWFFSTDAIEEITNNIRQYFYKDFTIKRG